MIFLSVSNITQSGQRILKFLQNLQNEDIPTDWYYFSEKWPFSSFKEKELFNLLLDCRILILTQGYVYRHIATISYPSVNSIIETSLT